MMVPVRFWEMIKAGEQSSLGFWCSQTIYLSNLTLDHVSWGLTLAGPLAGPRI